MGFLVLYATLLTQCDTLLLMTTMLLLFHLLLVLMLLSFLQVTMSNSVPVAAIIYAMGMKFLGSTSGFELEGSGR